nr:MAG TPA_asm: hypothetical protein [Caudoviricetes sp.]
MICKSAAVLRPRAALNLNADSWADFLHKKSAQKNER